jgi:hypothetical protein
MGLSENEYIDYNGMSVEGQMQVSWNYSFLKYLQSMTLPSFPVVSLEAHDGMWRFWYYYFGGETGSHI